MSAKWTLSGSSVPYKSLNSHPIGMIMLNGMVYAIIWEVPWKHIFKIGASTAASKFCEWIRGGTDILMSGLLTVVSDRIARAFNRYRQAGLLHKLNSYGILSSSFPGNRWLCVVLDGKGSQEYLVNAGVPQGYILGSALFLLYINDLSDNVIFNIAIYADDTSLY